MKQKELFGHEIRCPICGKGFISHEEWAYFKYCGSYKRKYCSWHCLQASRKKDGTKIDRRDRVIQAIKDGLSNSEIRKLVGEDNNKIIYWRTKLQEEGQDDASLQNNVRQMPDGDQVSVQSNPD